MAELLAYYTIGLSITLLFVIVIMFLTYFTFTKIKFDKRNEKVNNFPLPKGRPLPPIHRVGDRKHGFELNEPTTKKVMVSKIKTVAQKKKKFNLLRFLRLQK